MGDLSAISAENLAQRRQQLKRKRGWKVFQTIWRTLLVSGMATGLVWSMTLSFWLIRDSDQIIIQGNQFLSEDTIRNFLPVNYPFSLLWLQPQELIVGLERSAPIAEVSISRQLFPPRLIVAVHERHPVAQASLLQDPSQQTSTSNSEAWGLIDERGVWMPIELFNDLDPTFSLPELKVYGIRIQHLQDWSELYQILLHSPIEVTELDWRDPHNLILHTELGIVHCGPYSSQFKEQLVVLDRMRNLTQYPDVKDAKYLDLSHPKSPYLQMKNRDFPLIKPLIHVLQ